MPHGAAAPSRSLRRACRISHSRRREHVFICMFYPSAALNPTHPDRKVRSAARRARAVAASRSPPAPTRARNFGRSRRARTYVRINSHRDGHHTAAARPTRATRITTARCNARVASRFINTARVLSLNRKSESGNGTPKKSKKN